MSISKALYRAINKKESPEDYNYSLLYMIKKPIRKWLTNTVACNCPFNSLRVKLYRLAGFKIGKNTFIGMHCYLDDMCFDLLSFGDNVIVSYGVYFACHGRNQGHLPIVVDDGAYIGMRASVISKNAGGIAGITIGKNADIGACTLVNRDIPDGATAVGVPCRIVRVPHDEVEILQSCDGADNSSTRSTGFGTDK